MLVRLRHDISKMTKLNAAYPESIYLYGAGDLGKLAIDFCEKIGISVVAVIDKNKTGTINSKHTKYPIIEPQALALTENQLPVYICIATVPFHVIKEDLDYLGFRAIRPFYELTSIPSGYPLDNGWRISTFLDIEHEYNRVLLALADKLSQDHYKSFVNWHLSQVDTFSDFNTVRPSMRYRIPELLSWLSRTEIEMVDVGAHHGQCVEILMNCNIKLKKAHLYEPDPQNFYILKQKLGSKKIVRLSQLAISDTSGVKNFFSGYNYCSRLDPTGPLEVRTQTLDSLNLTCQFLKIHTEGSELSVLKGAYQTILKNKPALSLSIYHNDNGISRVVSYIASNFPWYSIYLRCHSFQGTGAFLYCIPK